MNLSEETLNQIESKIQQHHQIYRIPVKAESWEDLADQAINGEKTEYKPFNHNIVFDLNLTVDSNHYKSSLKAGVIKGDRLHFSSHRLGRFESLDDKINFLDNVEYDNFLFLSRNDNTIWDKTYHILSLDSKLITYRDLNWVEELGKRGKYKSTVSSWVGTSNGGNIKCKIVKAMSHQLWVDIDLSLVNKLKKIVIC